MKRRKTYPEKLKDPRWQKKRLEVLERAGWKCEGCGNATETLHVHHGYYERGYEPWEYDVQSLWSLCLKCHEVAEEARRDLYWELAHILPTKLTPYMVDWVRTEADRAVSARRGDLVRARRSVA